jgi:hypothetical protein
MSELPLESERVKGAERRPLERSGFGATVGTAEEVGTMSPRPYVVGATGPAVSPRVEASAEIGTSPPVLLGSAEVGRRVRKSPQSLRCMVRRGLFPAPLYVGRTPVWIEEVLNGWLLRQGGGR